MIHRADKCVRCRVLAGCHRPTFRTVSRTRWRPFISRGAVQRRSSHGRGVVPRSVIVSLLRADDPAAAVAPLAVRKPGRRESDSMPADGGDHGCRITAQDLHRLSVFPPRRARPRFRGSADMRQRHCHSSRPGRLVSAPQTQIHVRQLAAVSRAKGCQPFGSAIIIAPRSLLPGRTDPARTSYRTGVAGAGRIRGPRPGSCPRTTDPRNGNGSGRRRRRSSWVSPHHQPSV